MVKIIYIFEIKMEKNNKILESNRIDRCINCDSNKEIKTYITMEIGEGNYNNGPMCKDCFNSYSLEQSTVSFNV
jgi:hypothetical protein|tara:strand:+ start:424 stop:645 length:222 start_codon:yes stop_codon:yes gene_type:complete